MLRQDRFLLILLKINDLTEILRKKYSRSPTGVDLDHGVGEKRRSMVVNEHRSLVSGYVHTLADIMRGFPDCERKRSVIVNYRAR